MKGDCHNKPIKYLFLQAENPPALDMHESTLLYIKQGLKVHKRAFSPVIIIGDHVYRVFFTHSIDLMQYSYLGCTFSFQIGFFH